MKRITTAIIIVPFFILVSCSTQEAVLNLPTGFRVPNKEDIIEDWTDTGFKEPYHTIGDYNGDGKQDDAYILLKNDSKGWGVYVFLSTKNKSKKNVKVKSFEEISIAQRVMILTKPPGVYKTRCGYYNECEEGDLTEIEVKNDILVIGPYYSGGGITLYWDEDSQGFVVMP